MQRYFIFIFKSRYAPRDHTVKNIALRIFVNETVSRSTP